MQCLIRTSEVWAVAPDSNGKYLVSTQGRICNTRTGFELKQRPNQNRYMYVLYCVSRRKVLYRTVHRLVARAFLPNPDNLPTVDHIDRDITNNCVTNLRFASHSLQSHNCTKKANTVSIFRGLSYTDTSRPWRASIYKGGFYYYLGKHLTELEAAVAYNDKAIQLYGKDACLNNI
jgi:hypothetical protein